jgi:acyl-CoA ligase (AMP-forming) (exosortase A-associated)
MTEQEALWVGEGSDKLPACLSALVCARVSATPSHAALVERGQTWSYQALWALACHKAEFLQNQGVNPGDRVVLWAAKSLDMVSSLLGVWLAGGVCVIASPVLKAPQVAYLVADSGARLVLTQPARAPALEGALAGGLVLESAVLVLTQFDTPHASPADFTPVWRAPHDLAALLYTSGSTGKPKGVMLSHKNLILGAESVQRYLQLTAQDRVLCVLPFGFDYGLNQLLSCWHTGACAVLLDYLLPQDVLRALSAQRITGLAGVPPLWVQLADLAWPPGIAQHLRYITNSGGRLPVVTTKKLQALLPNTQIHLMYGLTEAFRSTSLDPACVAHKPESVGKAIPFAHIDVVRSDGTLCGVDEPGELVHSGPLVAQGYWQDSVRTAERFRPAPWLAGSPIAVWSGDRVVRDAQGDIRFIARLDEMIKSSGYRISPTEVEEALYATGLVREAAVFGVEDALLGQAIGVVATPVTPLTPTLQTKTEAETAASNAVLTALKALLPAYQLPKYVVWVPEIPRTSSGKLDRVWAKAHIRACLAL